MHAVVSVPDQIGSLAAFNVAHRKVSKGSRATYIDVASTQKFSPGEFALVSPAINGEFFIIRIFCFTLTTT
jgi:hypothetical protein